jgi:hypothetical protein
VPSAAILLQPLDPLLERVVAAGASLAYSSDYTMKGGQPVPPVQA